MHYWHFPINGYELGPVYTICIFQHIYKDCHVGRLIFPFDIGPNTTENSGCAHVAADHQGKRKERAIHTRSHAQRCPQRQRCR